MADQDTTAGWFSPIRSPSVVPEVPTYIDGDSLHPDETVMGRQIKLARLARAYRGAAITDPRVRVRLSVILSPAAAYPDAEVREKAVARRRMAVARAELAGFGVPDSAIDVLVPGATSATNPGVVRVVVESVPQPTLSGLTVPVVPAPHDAPKPAATGQAAIVVENDDGLVVVSVTASTTISGKPFHLPDANLTLTVGPNGKLKAEAEAKIKSYLVDVKKLLEVQSGTVGKLTFEVKAVTVAALKMNQGEQMKAELKAKLKAVASAELIIKGVRVEVTATVEYKPGAAQPDAKLCAKMWGTSICGGVEKNDQTGETMPKFGAEWEF